MVVPLLVGLAAAAMLVAAAFVAKRRATHNARALTFAGLGLAVLAIVLAAETEARYRVCQHEQDGLSAQEQLDAFVDQYPELRGMDVSVVFSSPACERRPW